MSKKLLNYLGSIALAGFLISCNPSKHTEIPQSKNLDSGRITLEVVVNEDEQAGRDIAEIIADGLEKIKWGQNAEGYREAYNIFWDAYKMSIKKLSETNNPTYMGWKVISLMHRGLVLFSAGNNIVDGRKLGDRHRGDNLKEALGDYKEAIELRRQINRENPNLITVYHSRIGYMPVAEESFIRERMAQVYRELIDLCEGKEKEGYQRKLLENYEILTRLTNDAEREGYQRELQKMLNSLKKTGKGA